ncbi:MAG: hypothetical protein ACTS78_03950 [Arsenophonus sp. NC-WZS1-MAG3]
MLRKAVNINRDKRNFGVERELLADTNQFDLYLKALKMVVSLEPSGFT